MEHPEIPDFEKRSLANQIADDIVNRIKSQTIIPGSTLSSEQQMAQEFGVSRPVIQKALHRLEGQGYVRKVRGKGTVVCEPQTQTLTDFFTWVLHSDLKNWTDLIVVRRALEVESARAAASNRTARDISTLWSIYSDMEEERDDPHAYNQLDIQLHLAIAEASGNEYFRHLIESVREALMTILDFLRINLEPEMYPIIQENHRRIITAIETGDSVAAGRAMTAHFAEVIERIGRFADHRGTIIAPPDEFSGSE